jgi:hypothetical protein
MLTEAGVHLRSARTEGLATSFLPVRFVTYFLAQALMLKTHYCQWWHGVTGEISKSSKRRLGVVGSMDHLIFV